MGEIGNVLGSIEPIKWEVDVFVSGMHFAVTGLQNYDNQLLVKN